MKSGFRRRFWVELAAASLAVALCVITRMRPDWIEHAVGLDPDGHAGWLEAVISVGALLVTVSIVTATVLEWRRARLPDEASRGRHAAEPDDRAQVIGAEQVPGQH